jgi:hypothetical protein
LQLELSKILMRAPSSTIGTYRVELDSKRASLRREELHGGQEIGAGARLLRGIE